MTRTDAGYSLLEALIAFTILATGLIAFYEIAGVNLRGWHHVATREAAIDDAQAILESFVPDDFDALGTREGVLGRDGVRWRVTVAKGPFPQISDAGMVVRDVSLEILSADAEPIFSIHTYRIAPHDASHD
jgi:hypothetical protein